MQLLLIPRLPPTRAGCVATSQTPGVPCRVGAELSSRDLRMSLLVVKASSPLALSGDGLLGGGDKQQDSMLRMAACMVCFSFIYISLVHVRM